MENGIDWLIRLGLLVDGDGPICKVFDKFDQWVIEYNPVQSDVSGNEQLDTASDHGAFATSKKSSKPLVSTASKDIWHRRLGHVSMDAIEHLPDALSGVQVVRSQTLPKSSTSPCEGCAVANLQHQISRRPAQRASRPFERVHFDLIQMNRAYNGDEWAMHFMCDKVRSHYGYTFRKKSDARATVQDFTAFVKRQYDQDILVWHTDGEKVLEQRSFGDWLREEGFIFETSAPYTQAQNGSAERAGGVIMRKARAMRIEAKLPENLWPEFFKSAVYITNRTPTKQLGWLTPIETLHRELNRPNPRPAGAHLHILGSRVYVLINKIPKKAKLSPRALIGYLVGYDSTNIFRI